MKVQVLEGSGGAVEAGLLVVPVPSGLESETLTKLSEASGEDLAALAREEHFEAEVAKTFLLRALPGISSRRLLLVGIGGEDDRATGEFRRAAVAAARVARDTRSSHVAVTCDDGLSGRLAEFAEGFELGVYKFDRHLSADDDTFDGTDTLSILSDDDGLKAQLGTVEAIAAAVNFARDLVNESPNLLVPETLVQAAHDVGSQWHLETTVFDESRLQADGFNLIMAVGKGSEHPPRLAHLVYRPEGEIRRKIAFVGKGVTFDTGGYNIKPGKSMLNMHCDMAGAAAVIGAARAIGELRPSGVEVHFITPSAENTIANNSFKPQDIFRGYGGKTVEIHNTDAEGRLLLADALAYAQEQEVDTIVDLATLTGACVVALGENTAGLFSDDDELVDGLMAASKLAGEDLWRMPLTKKLDSQLDTPMADMKNVGPRWGGAITAALFLKRWVELDRWAHLDIAGPAWAESDDDLSPEGGTGFAVATLTHFVLGLSQG